MEKVIVGCKLGHHSSPLALGHILMTKGIVLQVELHSSFWQGSHEFHFLGLYISGILMHTLQFQPVWSNVLLIHFLLLFPLTNNDDINTCFHILLLFIPPPSEVHRAMLFYDQLVYRDDKWEKLWRRSLIL